MKNRFKLLLDKLNLKNENGAALVLVVAVVIVSVTLLSSVSLIQLIKSDSLMLEYQKDALQEEILLRSESDRSHIAVEYNEYRPIPTRKVQIGDRTSERITTYTIESSKENIIVSNFMGYAAQRVVSIKSHITANRGTKYARSYRSPVERLTEKLIQHESLAEYQYFTEYESSENADGGTEAAAVKFWGQDILYGKVHSNDDIWIQNAGGGNNGGWPTFYEHVTTAGEFLHYDDGTNLFEWGAPMDDIFLGGWTENVPGIVFSATMDDIRHNGEGLLGGLEDMAYVELEGSSFNGYLGTIVLTEVKQFPVYSWFPVDDALVNAVIDAGFNWYQDTDLIYTNSISIFDTTWSPTSGATVGSSKFVDGNLYIHGSAGGKQTWGAADTVFVIGDITYPGTQYGETSDGLQLDDDGNPITDFDGNLVYNANDVNERDFFGLVSEEDILIAYKFRFESQGTTEIHTTNIDGITMYGAYAAVGAGDENIHGDMACHYDGIFSFHYQHPYGSTPNFDSVSPWLVREYVLRMKDTPEDGWDGAEINLYRNVELINLNPLTCNGDETEFEFNLEHGDQLDTQYFAGDDATLEPDHSYEIYYIDEVGDEVIVAQDGPSPGETIQYICVIEDPIDTLYQYVDLQKYIYPANNFVTPEKQVFNWHRNALQGGGSEIPYPFGVAGFPTGSFPLPTAYTSSFPNSGGGYVGPDGTDMPWLNPMWPESAATASDAHYFETRYAKIFGAIAQRRRGFMRRSGSDAYNHPSPRDSDFESYHYGAEHLPTGYNKRYYYDRRFLFEQPPDYPQIYRGWGQNDVSSFTEQTWFFKTIDE